MTPLRLLAIGSGIVAVVMVVLTRIGTYDEGLFHTWLVLLFVSGLVCAGALKADEVQRKRRLDAERTERLRGTPR